MSVLSDVFAKCATMQVNLDQRFAQGLVQAVEPIAGAEFIASPVNTNGLQQEILPGEGKVRTVRTIYAQRLLESDVTEFDSPTCTAEGEIQDRYTDYTMDTTTGLRNTKLLTRNQLREACAGNADKFYEYVSAMVNVMDRAVATQWMNQLAAMYGTWSTDVTGTVTNDALVVPTYLPSTTTIDPKTLWTIDLSLLQTGYSGPRLIIGNEKLLEYYNMARHGCCTDNGLDVGQLFASYGIAVAWDSRLGSALSTDADAMVLQPGAVFPLNFYNGAWKDELKRIPVIEEASSYGLAPVRSPRLGLTYDLKIVDECANGGQINLILEAVTDLRGLPGDVFGTGDKYEGRNGVNLIKVTNT